MSYVPLRVSDYMRRDLITATPETEIMQIVKMLIDNDVSGLLIVDDAGSLVGILTERDCIDAATSAGYYDEWGGPASGFMSAPVETVSSDDNLVDVAVRMSQSEYRRFPVVDDGRLVGLIGRRDVLSALGRGTWFARQA